jgi:uncharacterized caspase-like protein
LALVLSNGKYRSLSSLDNPANDASTMAGVLQKLNFDVVEFHDLDRVSTWRKVEDFARRIKVRGPDAVGLVFYAGHGLEDDGENYVVPVDADIRSRSEIKLQALSVRTIAEQLGKAGNQINILVLDACRNNPFRGRSFRGGALRGLTPMGAVYGVFIASSTAAGDVALDGTGDKNSPYTHALSEAIMTPGAKLEDVFKSVRRRVRIATGEQQIPWESSSLEVDFYFIPPPQQVPAAQQLLEVGRQTRNLALLELVVQRYGDSPAAAEAAKLLGELRRDAAAAKAAEALDAKDYDRRIEEMARTVMRRAEESRSPEAFELVATLFPGTRYAAEAAVKAGSLRAEQAAAKAEPQLDGSELVRAIQTELLRVGCRDGQVTGRFDPTTIQGLRTFSNRSDARFYWHRPTMAALRALRKEAAEARCGNAPIVSQSKCMQVNGEAICE